MKLISALPAAILIFALPAWAENVLESDKIYNFYQPSCPHCHEAINYINAKYPNVKMELVNITSGHDNYNLFMQCAKKFRLGREIGTPLFCMGNQYIMGWSQQQQEEFDEYVKDFKD